MTKNFKDRLLAALKDILNDCNSADFASVKLSIDTHADKYKLKKYRPIVVEIFDLLTDSKKLHCEVCKKTVYKETKRYADISTSLVFRGKTICYECLNNHDRDFEKCEYENTESLNLHGNPSKMTMESHNYTGYFLNQYSVKTSDSLSLIKTNGD